MITVPVKDINRRGGVKMGHRPVLTKTAANGLLKADWARHIAPLRRISKYYRKVGR
jgi:hypothetical protein